MKKRYLLLALVSVAAMAMSAKDLTGTRIYVNPGHGSFGPNDRPMATIPYPNLASTGMPDTCGFYETNTNLWKCLYLGERLEKAGATVVYSRKANGPWDYEKDANGEYIGYTWAQYSARPDYNKYNRELSDICEEVEVGNFDLFISVHSNAATEGTTTNYPLWLYRGTDETPSDFEKTCKEIGADIWPYRYEMMAAGYDPASYYSLTNMNLRGDCSFQNTPGSWSTRSNGQQYFGWYGVLKHGVVGGLYEGYFHTYQPARHRALNHDHCHIEGYSYYRGIIDYFGADKDTKGYILGTVKDLHEKIVNNLFKYSPKTNDQWLPLNGATVKLLKNGREIASYEVDTFYNGVFCFYDLEPGTYTLDASCEGYKPLFDEYKTPIVVEANKVTYPMIYLESESYEPPKEVFYTYPEPEQAATLGMPSNFVFDKPQQSEKIDALSSKTIRRSILRNDSTMYVLAIDDAKEPYLYLVNPTTMQILATLPTDFCTVSTEGNLKLSDIAVTADGVLIGCNEEKTSYTPSNNWNVYNWTKAADGTWSGKIWLTNTTNETSGNYSNAITGSTIAYTGSFEEGTLYTTAYTIGSEAHGVRFIVYTISDSNYAGALRNQNSDFTLASMGHNIKFTASPLGDDKVIITDDHIAPMQWEVVNQTAQAPIITTMSDEYKGLQGISCFKYAKHSVMVAPDAGGIFLFDITNGLDKTTNIKSNTQIPLPSAAPQAKMKMAVAADANYALAAATVHNEDLVAYWLSEGYMNIYSTVGVEQPTSIGVYAYDLKATLNSGVWTISFKSNDAATARIILYSEDGEEAKVIDIDEVKKGANTIELPVADLPSAEEEYTWAVELQADNVAHWQVINRQTSESLNMVRVFNTVNNYPSTENFGKIYLNFYSAATRLTANQGMFVMNQEYELENTTPKLGGNSVFGCLYRPTIDAEGTVYFVDWTDPNSGVYVAEDGNLDYMPQFFLGSRNTATGVFTYKGVETGSSTPAAFVYGKGADTKLVVYNEDKGNTLVENGLCIYNIGQEDGTIRHTWNEAPSKVLSIPGQLNSEGNVWAVEEGIWVSQNRGAGNNNYSATSLQFFDWEGNRLFCSADDEYNEVIIGSDGSAFALTQDKKTLVLNGVDNSFYVFNVAWADGTPTLTLRYEYKHGMGTFRQLNFDYAGNLIATGDAGLAVFAMPHEGNTITTPAMEKYTIAASPKTYVEGVTLDKTEAEIALGETITLTATVLPDNAANTEVIWVSSNNDIATVDENGVVTANELGTAVITVKTVDGNYKARCSVKVIEVTGVDNINAIEHSAHKYIKDGVIYIEKDGEIYTTTGIKVQ